jgi:DNA-directed RNA polymerase subunit M/transcription elongation factor TFIIS
MLNKEFKRKDVERMRNLIKGKVGESAELQVGFTTKIEDHKEGDIWEEGGKKWTIKDGIKQTATKLDKAKKEAILPLFCPNCGSLMKKRNDTKMYNIHKMCFDCVIEMEGKLKIQGKYKEYERNTIANNAEDHINHLEAYLMEALNTSNEQYVSEKGEVERWKGGVNKEKLTPEIKQAIVKFKEDIEKYRNNTSND